MKHLLLPLLFCCLSLQAQQFPMLVVIEGDTLIAMTVDQARIVNAMEVETRKYRQLSDEFKSISRMQAVSLIRVESVVELLRQENALREGLQGKCDGVIQDLTKHLHKTEKKLKRQMFWRNLLITVVTGEALLLILTWD
jgi:hypothetical protein